MVNPFKAWAMSNGVDTGKQGQDERVQQQALKPGKRKKSQRMTRAEQLSLRHPVSVQDAAKALMLSEVPSYILVLFLVSLLLILLS